MSEASDVPNIEVGLLSMLFDLYPDQSVTAEDLIRRAMEADRQRKVEDYEEALRNLRHAELVRETNGRIIPTPAALHFEQLPF